jgi:hypothetical protein
MAWILWLACSEKKLPMHSAKLRGSQKTWDLLLIGAIITALHA